jgi:nitrobindin-like protein
MNRALAVFVVCGFLTFPGLGAAMRQSEQATAAADPLQPLAFLIGRWEGTSEGQPGSGTVRREYARVLNSRFIRAENQSIYAAQPKNPKGETHDHFEIFSFDRSRRRAILRQFHVEGFVNQYAADLGAQANRIEFTSEAIENIPAGWHARETYVLLGPDEFEEVFELAEPGKGFDVYSRARLKRVHLAR